MRSDVTDTPSVFYYEFRKREKVNLASKILLHITCAVVSYMNSVVFSPLANYTDLAIAAGQRS
jgi:hypothetical protein